jgi:hypothetical protein
VLGGDPDPLVNWKASGAVGAENAKAGILDMDAGEVNWEVKLGGAHQ